MSQLGASGRRLLDVLRNSLIPSAGDAAPFVVLGVPPRVIGASLDLDSTRIYYAPD